MKLANHMTRSDGHALTDQAPSRRALPWAFAILFSLLWGLFVVGTSLSADLPPTPTVSAQAGPSVSPSSPGRNGSNGLNGRERLRAVTVQVVSRAAEGLSLRGPTGVFADHTSDDVYVADPELGMVVVYRRGTEWPVLAIGYNGELKAPRKAVADGQGGVYVLDLNPPRVKVFTYRGEPVGTFGFPGLPDASKVVPTALWADASGNLYIGDSGAEKRVLVYGPKGELRQIVGRNGKAAGELSSVASITTDAQGRIYVLDAVGPLSLLVFSPEGAFLRGWGRHDAGVGNFSLPAGIAVDSQGRILAVDTLRQITSIFSENGTFLGFFGGFGGQAGDLAYPTDVATDAASRAYVVDRVGARMQVFELRAAQDAETRTRDDRQAERTRAALREEVRTLSTIFLKPSR